MYTYKEMSENMCISQPICNRVGRALSRAKTANDQVVSKGKPIVLIMNEWSADPNSTADRPLLLHTSYCFGKQDVIVNLLTNCGH